MIAVAGTWVRVTAGTGLPDEPTCVSWYSTMVVFAVLAAQMSPVVSGSTACGLASPGAGELSVDVGAMFPELGSGNDDTVSVLVSPT